MLAVLRGRAQREVVRASARMDSSKTRRTGEFLWDRLLKFQRDVQPPARDLEKPAGCRGNLVGRRSGSTVVATVPAAAKCRGPSGGAD